MTVCVAALCRNVYANGDIGPAVVVASDRMMTDNDFEYEPPTMKIAQLTSNAIVLIAGAITHHTAVLDIALRRTSETNPTLIKELAEIYASGLRDVTRRGAETEYLGLFGLSMETFLERQSRLSEVFVADMVNKIAGHALDFEALVAGYDAGAHIYTIDNRGYVSCHDDIGFAAIGLGYLHAKSQFMLAKYGNIWMSNSAVTLLHLAKKSAEAAPDVGTDTDIHFIGRESVFRFPDEWVIALDKEYREYVSERQALFQRTVTQQFAAIDKLRKANGDVEMSNSDLNQPVNGRKGDDPALSIDGNREQSERIDAR